jgi:hypothetical protein
MQQLLQLLVAPLRRAAAGGCFGSVFAHTAARRCSRAADAAGCFVAASVFCC